MTDFATLLQGGNAWLFIPSAVALGALHGLEPGHSKTMMAAFIIAVRGTVMQAVLLGLAATLSHTAVVWAIALAGLHFGSQFNSESIEPYFQLLSAVLIIGVAVWMVWRTWAEQRGHGASEHHHHHHDHHDAETHVIDTERGALTLSVFEDGVPPRWRLRASSGSLPPESSVIIETVRAGGDRQLFGFVSTGAFLESVNDIPEPHEFKAHVTVGHGDHTHDYAFDFHEHDHDRGVIDVGDSGGDAHARAHADDIKKRFANRHVTTGQIVMFGLTGGLIPCPASITILLLCLQLKEIALGATLVLCFSIGLALTMVSFGVVAALSINRVSKKWSGFAEFARKAPYVSGALIMLVGLYTAYLGWSGLSAHAGL